MAKKFDGPTNLSPASRRMWTEVTNTYELDVLELRTLEDLLREYDLVDRLEKDMRAASTTVKGSQGQPVANGLLAELARHRSTAAQLRDKLRLPAADDGGRAQAERSASARELANARWNRAG